MILIITHKEDYTADFVINKLNNANIKYKRFNCEDLLKHDFSLGIDLEFNYSILGENNYKSIWFRRTKSPLLPDSLDVAERLYLINEIEGFFKNMFSSIQANWLSVPSKVYEAENKILQLKIAKEIGFIIPQTLITNSKEKLKEFYKECENEMILKPIRQTRIQYKNGASFIFTNPVPNQFIDELENYDLTPCIFQKSIHKEYELRITVVGEMVFSAAVNSQEDQETIYDWRKKKLKFYQIEIPKEIEEKCIALVKALNLQFGAIDMIKTPGGEYIFLEINPNGQWAWIETQTGLDISGEIIKILNQ